MGMDLCGYGKNEILFGYKIFEFFLFILEEEEEKKEK